MLSVAAKFGRKLLGLAALIAVGGSQGRAQGGRPVYPITAEQVARLLSSQGLPLTAESIRLPGVLVSRQPSPALEVVEAERSATNEARLRLKCRVAGDCLPFLLTLHTPVALTDQNLLDLEHVSHQTSSASTRETLRLRVGQHTMLLFQTNRMRICLPVILIDTGELGAEVRVASLDRKQTYRARVIASDEVLGDLPE